MESDDESQYPVIEKVVPRRKLGNSDYYCLLTLFSLFLDKESEEEMESDDEYQYPVIEKVVPRRKLGNSDAN